MMLFGAFFAGISPFFLTFTVLIPTNKTNAMVKRGLKIKIVLCLILAAMGLLLMVITAGKVAAWARIIVGVFALWMLYGAYRGRVHWQASSPIKGVSAAKTGWFEAEPGTAWDVIRRFFSCSDMRFRTMGSFFWMLFLGVYAYVFGRISPVWLWLLVGVTVVVKGVLLYQLLRYERILRAYEYVTVVDEWGVANRFLAPDGDQPMARGVRWDSITELFWLPNALIVGVGKEREFAIYFLNKAQKAECKAVCAQYFRPDEAFTKPTAKGVIELASIAEKVQPLLRQTVAFKLSQPEEPPGKSASRFGGRPLVTPDFVWPRRDGRPMTMLMQVNCADIAAEIGDEAFPKSGRLAFFYDTEGPDEAGNVQSVVFTEGPAEALTQAEYPDDLPAEGRLEELAVSFRHGYTAPDYVDFMALGASNRFYTADEVDEVTYQYAVKSIDFVPVFDDVCVGVMGGYARVVDFSMLSDEPGEDVLLLQLWPDDVPGFVQMQGDVDSISFYVKRQDMRNRDFSKVWSGLQLW